MAKGKGRREKQQKAPQGRAAKRKEDEIERKEVIDIKKAAGESVNGVVGVWGGDDYSMDQQDWPSFVLLKGQSYHGVGKRRSPKKDIHVDQVYLLFPAQILLRAETTF